VSQRDRDQRVLSSSWIGGVRLEKEEGQASGGKVWGRGERMEEKKGKGIKKVKGKMKRVDTEAIDAT